MALAAINPPSEEEENHCCLAQCWIEIRFRLVKGPFHTGSLLRPLDSWNLWIFAAGMTRLCDQHLPLSPFKLTASWQHLLLITCSRTQSEFAAVPGQMSTSVCSQLCPGSDICPRTADNRSVWGYMQYQPAISLNELTGQCWSHNQFVPAARLLPQESVGRNKLAMWKAALEGASGNPAAQKVFYLKHGMH